MDPAISLTVVEANLKRLLLDVAHFVEHHPAAKDATPLVLRFSGGWVRDKLLNKDSKDIDVTIDRMTGYQFGLKIQEYLKVPGNAGKYVTGDGANRQTTAKISKIEANPDKSKHLETATTKVFGLEIDLVNLRKETYTEDSRNPQVEFGTPEEDAMRRDATINAMFYNLNTSSVEDLTRRGLDDLKNGLIRTPLEPVETFTDDPLRVLRLIRFAARFGYEIDRRNQKGLHGQNHEGEGLAGGREDVEGQRSKDCPRIHRLLGTVPSCICRPIGTRVLCPRPGAVVCNL
jgi:tRNA nucleotidyltransferase (CCA-adding enzyme)